LFGYGGTAARRPAQARRSNRDLACRSAARPSRARPRGAARSPRRRRQGCSVVATGSSCCVITQATTDALWGNTPRHQAVALPVLTVGASATNWTISGRSAALPVVIVRAAQSRGVHRPRAPRSPAQGSMIRSLRRRTQGSWPSRPCGGLARRAPRPRVKCRTDARSLPAPRCSPRARHPRRCTSAQTHRIARFGAVDPHPKLRADRLPQQRLPAGRPGGAIADENRELR